VGVERCGWVFLRACLCFCICVCVCVYVCIGVGVRVKFQRCVCVGVRACRGVYLNLRGCAYVRVCLYLSTSIIPSKPESELTRKLFLQLR
jgi:hypothetical protein